MCKMHQTTYFEVICIRSIHTLVTESKYNYGLHTLYCVGTKLNVHTTKLIALGGYNG